MLRKFFPIVILALIALACREPRVPNEKTLSDDCRVSEFTEYGIGYSFEFDSEGYPAKRYRADRISSFPNQLFEYQGGKLLTIYLVSGENKYVRTKYEYRNDVLSSIRQFENLNIIDPAQITEMQRVDFQYNTGNKPMSLIRWVRNDKNVLIRSHESAFDYDVNGNLVVEKVHLFPQGNVVEGRYTIEYFYDDKINSQKQLNYLYFSAIDSAPRVFSKNNVNRIKMTFDHDVVRDHMLKLAYDSEEHVANDGYLYSDIKWLCQ